MNVNERAAQMLNQYADELRERQPDCAPVAATKIQEREADARALANGLTLGMHFITAAPVEPDRDGFWTHPAIPDHFDEDPAPFERWLNEQLLECVTREVGDEDEGVAADWEDSKPAGAGWFLLELIDTEDGPTAFWVRRQTATIADLREALANALEADPNTPEGYLILAAARDVLARTGGQDTLSQYDRGWNDHMAAAALPPRMHVVLHELNRACRKFPTWPTDPLHAMGVVNEEVGELSKAVLQAVYEPEKNPEGAVEKEALQAAAMLLRFLASLDQYEFTGAPQHTQPLTSARLADARHTLNQNPSYTLNLGKTRLRWEGRPYTVGQDEDGNWWVRRSADRDPAVPVANCFDLGTAERVAMAMNAQEEARSTPDGFVDVRRYIEDTVALVLQECGNSYANAWCQRLLETAQAAGVYTGAVTGNIYDLMNEWQVELKDRQRLRSNKEGAGHG